MASMKRVLDGLLKKYSHAKTITMGALSTMGALHYSSSPKNYAKDSALAKRMIRRCYRIKPGFAGGVVNPFYKAPRKKRSIIKRYRDGNINVTGTIEAYCNSK